MSRTYGVCSFHENPDHWRIAAEPHVIIFLKNVFPRIATGRTGTITLKHTDEVARNLEWFLLRFPLEVDAASLKVLKGASKRYRDTILRLEEMVDLNYVPREFTLAIPARIYQRQAAEVFLARKSLLLADDVGLGKTASALCALTDPKTLPAVVVTLAGSMPRQWEEEAGRFLPDLLTHVLRKGTPYPLPGFMGRSPDLVIMNYHKLSGWSATLAKYARTVIFDEIQELRRSESAKYDAAMELAEGCRYRLGLSATPIYNYGSEIWNVLNVVRPNALGSRDEFLREWCADERILDPKAFGTYAREQFLIVRRTRKDVGRELPPLTKIPHTIDTDAAPLTAVEDAAAELARIILADGELHRGDKMQAAEELSWKLRHATGVAKAPHVADFVRLLVESGERVVVFGWHRAVYEILASRLSEYSPALFTGEETTAEKVESRRRFIEGETPILLMSLRAGAGVDGLQKVCRTAVFAELDWSPGVHEQCIGRIFRDGQTDGVTAYFLISEEGSDPVVAETLGVKREQVDGIKDPNRGAVEDLQVRTDRAASLAKFYLEKIGRAVPETAGRGA